MKLGQPLQNEGRKQRKLTFKILHLHKMYGKTLSCMIVKAGGKKTSRLLEQKNLPHYNRIA
jgi:hypothetical protein